MRHESAIVREPKIHVEELILPFHFGDTIDTSKTPKQAMLISPAQFRPFVEATLRNGVHATVILGDGNCVCRVRIDGLTIQIEALSPNSNYSQIKRAYPNSEGCEYLGYGYLLRVGENIEIGFLPWDREPTSDQTPDWVDLLPTIRCPYAMNLP